MVPAFEALLRENNLDSIDALFANDVGERLDKPGLPAWRQRRRLVLCDPPEPPLCKGGGHGLEGSGHGLEDRGQGREGVGHGPRMFYLKRFADPPISARREVRRSGTGAKSVAGLEWTWMNRLTREGISCVQPVAFAEELRGSREVRSAILTKAVPGDSLERWASRWNDNEAVRTLLAPLAKLVSRLHTAGYVHRDLYLSHIFFDPTATPDNALCLIDLQRMIRPAVNLKRWIIKDLASLNYSTPRSLVSRADRLRWLKLYLGAVRLDDSARCLVYRVIGKTLRIESRDARRRLREPIP